MSKTPLSASRIKTLQSCSWEFYSLYYLKVPNPDNTGSIMGSTVHQVFEYLGKEKRRDYFDTLIKTQKLKSVQSVYRYCLAFLRSKGLNPFDECLSAQKEKISFIDLVERMIFAGLNYDFFGESENPDESHTEIDFDLDIEEGDKSYRVRGFVDKLFLIKDKSIAKIRDFKSSKSAYEGDEVYDNIQDLIYKLFVKKSFPEYERRQTEFVFLQHRDNEDFSIKTPVACNEELDGLEYFLTEIQDYVENFDEEDAKANLAKDKGFTPNFGGVIKCGKNVEYPGQLKKDGVSKAWHCAQKFPYFFYAIVKDGVVLDSKIEEKDLRELEEGEVIEKKFYKGCPSWRHLEYNKKINKEAQEQGFENIFEEEVDKYLEM